MNIQRAQIINLNQVGDDRGTLIVIEGSKDIPFEIARIFYIYGVEKNVVRGKHANRNSAFLFINISGSSKVKVDYGNTTEIYELNKPNIALFVPKMVWKDMYDFSSDSVLMVLSDKKYDETEYIRNYNDYLKEVMGAFE